MRRLFIALSMIGWGPFVQLAPALGDEPAATATAVEGVPPLVEPAEKVIQRALAQRTSIDVADMPLADVLNTIKDKHKIEIQFDDRALEDAAIQKDAPVTRNLKNVSLASALHLILSGVGLTHTIQDEVLLITTAEKARQTRSTRLLNVRDFGETTEKLAEVLRATLNAEAEADSEEPCFTIQTFRHVLIVTGPRSTHERVEALLAALREAEATEPGKQ